MRTSEHGNIECFSYLKKHDLENYVKEEATDPEGDEDKAQEGFSQSHQGLFPPPLDLTFIILVGSQGYVRYNDQPVCRKEYQHKYDIEELAEECEDIELRDHAVPLHKGFSNQRTT